MKLPNFSKKGQAALEFLMTYGWVIMVVLIIIGALAPFDEDMEFPTNFNLTPNFNDSTSSTLIFAISE